MTPSAIPTGTSLCDRKDRTTISLCLGFKCENRCSFCIVFSQRNALKKSWLSRIHVEKVLDSIRRTPPFGRYKRLVITGGEVTLYPFLRELVTCARKAGFESIQIQTNGRRLSDIAYCRSLIECGINEFFVSLQGHNAKIHDSMTGRQGSFSQSRKGIANIIKAGGDVTVNTVITSANYRYLEATVDMNAGMKVRKLHIWFITPTGDPHSQKMVPRVSDSAPYIKAALRACAANGQNVVVKYFPLCLMGKYGKTLDNFQPPDLIAPEELHRKLRENWGFSCPHEKTCADYARCGGLTYDYIKLYGTSELPPPGRAKKS